MGMKSIAPHEPQAMLLSAEDVDRDVLALSEALIEERAKRVARNVLLRSEIREILEDLLESGACENEENAEGFSVFSALSESVILMSP